MKCLAIVCFVLSGSFCLASSEDIVATCTAKHFVAGIERSPTAKFNVFRNKTNGVQIGSFLYQAQNQSCTKSATLCDDRRLRIEVRNGSIFSDTSFGAPSLNQEIRLNVLDHGATLSCQLLI